ncbi:MAG: hypothetical protein WC551_08535 [Patescibacteria group bacterium]
MTNIEPCPHCGAAFVDAYKRGPAVAERSYDNGTRRFFVFFVLCPECGARSDDCITTSEEEWIVAAAHAKAITLWNFRDYSKVSGRAAYSIPAVTELVDLLIDLAQNPQISTDEYLEALKPFRE